MALKWPPKDEDEVRPYGVNWGPLLTSISDTIDTSVLAVVSGGVVIDAQANDTTTMSCTISGGTNGTWATLTNTITTVTSGDTYEQTIYLLVQDSACILSVPSTATKLQIVQMAYEEAGQAGYEFDNSPEELASGLRKLDSLMGEWLNEGIDLHYNFPDAFGQGNLSDPAGIPDSCINGAAAWLGFRIMPGQGKAAGQPTIVALTMAKNAIRQATVRKPTMQFARNTPRGIGNKPWSIWSPYAYPVSSGCVDCDVVLP